MNTKQTLKHLLRYAKPYLGYLIAALFCSALSVTSTLLIPVIYGRAIDHIIDAGNVDFQAMIPLLIMLAACIVSGAAFQWLMSVFTNKAAYSTIRDLRVHLFEHIDRLPFKYLDTKSHGDLVQRLITDIELISDGLLQGFTNLFTGVITIIGTLAIMLTINSFIAMLVFLLTPLSLFVAYFISKRSQKMFLRQAELRGEISGLSEEMIGNQKTLKLFMQEDTAFARYQDINAELYESGVKSQFYSSISNPATRFVNGLIYAVVGVVGAFNVIRGGGLSVGQLSSFLSYSNQYTKPFNEITGVIAELQTAMAAAGRVFQIMQTPTEPSDAGYPALKNHDGTLDIAHVYFSYTPEKPLIQDFNLSVRAGEKIAIVGPTGCGKTTLINLLMRFYDIDAGQIKMRDQDISLITRESLRKNYGMVLQETWLFSGTIRENIAYGKPEASLAEVVEAAKLAHADEFIKNLPEGYETPVGERGAGISEGQKQLLCIARILLIQPPMLILDEATSNIDTRTEQKIQDAFSYIMQNRTSFIVAHRLSTIENADRILVMNQGNVIEQGTHLQLLEQKGFYYNLYHAQFAKE